MRILIAEDERITRRSLQKQLEAWGHEVTAAQDGAEAWERIEQERFDMVVTDWEMPRLDGRELIQRIRQSEQAAYIYLIMLTSHSATAEVVKGMEAGADDFLAKPFDRAELRARLNAGERIIRTERELSDNLRKLRESQVRIRRDMEAAARLQQGALPRAGLQHPNVTLAWKYIPCDELGGDGIGFDIVDDRYLTAYVLDVTGHGVPAALLSFSVSQALSAATGVVALPEGRVNDDGFGPLRDPSEVAAILNERFPTSAADGRFFTMVYAVIDLKTGLMQCVTAGHPPPCVYRRNNPFDLGDFGGLPIGVMPDADFPNATCQLEPGDRIFAVSDGILEAMNSDNVMFGPAPLNDWFRSRDDNTLTETVEALVQEIDAWTGGVFDDDVSVAALQWQP